MDLKNLKANEISKEAFKIINKNKKIFATPTLFFILPLAYTLSSLIGTLTTLFINYHQYGNISHIFITSHNFSFFWPSNVLSILLLFGYSIIATAGVSHTVAAVYTGLEPTLTDTISVIAKVWKRVLVTFACALLVVFAYHVVVGFALIVWTSFVNVDETTTKVVFFVFYCVGLLYFATVFPLAGVVSVFEDLCGFKAIEKSRFLLKGNIALVMVMLTVWLRAMSFISLYVFVLVLPPMPMFMSVLTDFLLLFLILVFLLWIIVFETMSYLVRKSYHHEGTDTLPLLNQDHMSIRSCSEYC